MVRVYDDNELEVYIRAWLGMGLSDGRSCSNVYSTEYIPFSCYQSLIHSLCDYIQTLKRGYNS